MKRILSAVGEVQELLKCLRECSSDEAYLSRQAADEITRLRADKRTDLPEPNLPKRTKRT